MYTTVTENSYWNIIQIGGYLLLLDFMISVNTGKSKNYSFTALHCNWYAQLHVTE